MDDKVLILKILKELGKEEFTEFKWHLEQFDIPKSALENANRQDTVDKIVQKHSQWSVEVVKQILQNISRNDLLEKLTSIARASEADPLQRRNSRDDLEWMHPAGSSCLESISTPTPDTAREREAAAAGTSAHEEQDETPDRRQTLRPNRKHSVPEKALQRLSQIRKTKQDQMNNPSSKYKDAISRSVQIHRGPPAVYQLESKKAMNFGSLRRMTVFEKVPNKSNKTILLLGETGAGKSTLVNALLNYSMGVKWEEDVWFQIIEERGSHTETQTSDVIVYEIFDFKEERLPYSLIIIDTPGYGNTRGIERDDIINRQLLDLFQSDDGVHEVHALGLVMKASDNRLSDRMRYVLDSVMSLFGKDLEKNIVALITHSDGRTPKNPLQALEDANIRCAKNEKNQPVYFMFNNCQHEDRTEGKQSLKSAYEISEQGMREFTAFLEKTAPQKLKNTAEVLNKRRKLMAFIQNLQERIQLTELKQSETKQIIEALKKHEEEMKKNENFTVEVDEVYKDKQTIKGGLQGLFFNGAVRCTVCKENCHYPGCTKAWTPESCEVMRRGRCTVCTRKCPALKHVKQKQIYMTKTRKVQKTLTDVKEKYEKNKMEKDLNLSLLDNLEKEMSQLTAEKSQFLEESYQHVARLEQIALKADSGPTIVHLDFLLEKTREVGDTEKVQKLEEMRSRVDEGTRAALRYKQYL